MVVGDFARDVDLVVIGAGPGGYVAAIRAAQLGRQVTIIERDQVGGVCLNVGCIPSKALISASHHYHDARQERFGVKASGVEIDFTATQAWKDREVVGRLTKGVAGLLKKNRVEIVTGQARFINPGAIHVEDDTQMGQTLQFKDCIIATGSRPTQIRAFPYGKRVVDSTGALNFTEIPRHLVVVGGGYIGMELASAYAHFGSQVTIIESLDRILAGFDADLTKPVEETLAQLGVTIHTGAKVTAITEDASEVKVTFTKDQEESVLAADYCLLAVGRTPNTDDIGLEMVGIDPDERGLIPVDSSGRTSQPHIWAIGDVVAGAPLAHKASYEAKVAAAAACGDSGAAVDYLAMPTVCFTTPEIATVGDTSGKEAKVTNFPYAGNGRSLSMGNHVGFVRLYTRGEEQRLVGACVVGPEASELIAPLTLAVENLLTAEDVALTIHNHPTLSEMIMDAAESALGHPIHS